MEWKQCLPLAREWEGWRTEEGGRLIFHSLSKVSFEFYSSNISWVMEPLLTQRQEPLSIWNKIQPNEPNSRVSWRFSEMMLKPSSQPLLWHRETNLSCSQLPQDAEFSCHWSSVVPYTWLSHRFSSPASCHVEPIKSPPNKNLLPPSFKVSG